MENRPLLCLLGLYLIMAAGCAVGPDFHPPKTTVPENWEGAADSGQRSLTADEANQLVEWWHSFNDSLLDSLVERAIASNFDLVQAKSRIRQARASRGVVTSGLWPQVNATEQYERRYTGGSSRTTQTGGARSGQASGTGGEERDLFQAGLDVVWELAIFRRSAAER